MYSYSLDMGGYPVFSNVTVTKEMIMEGIKNNSVHILAKKNEYDIRFQIGPHTICFYNELKFPTLTMFLLENTIENVAKKILDILEGLKAVEPRHYEDIYYYLKRVKEFKY